AASWKTWRERDLVSLLYAAGIPDVRSGHVSPSDRASPLGAAEAPVTTPAVRFIPPQRKRGRMKWPGEVCRGGCWRRSCSRAGPPGMAEETRPGPARPETVTIVLNDGSRLVGTVVDEDEAAVTLRFASGEDLRILRTSIARKESAPGANGKIAPPRSDPNDTRLMFAPSGRPLGKGDGYVSNHYVVFPGFAFGLTDH